MKKTASQTEAAAGDGSIDFSVLLPTRGRPHVAERFLGSLAATATNPAAIEVILRVDDDDLESHQLDHPALTIQKVILPRISLAEAYYQSYTRSHGRYILMIGDDHIFRTAGWDTQIKDAFQRFPDGIALVYGNDLIQGRNMCTAPFLTRKTWELLGRPYPHQYTGEFIDTHIYDLFFKLRCWGHDRTIYLDHIVIEHMHYVVGKAPFDATYAQNKTTDANRELYFSLDDLRVRQAKQLVAHISAGGADRNRGGSSPFPKTNAGTGTLSR